MKIIRLLAPLFLLVASAFGQVTMTQAPGTFTDDGIPRRAGTGNRYENTLVTINDNNGVNTVGESIGSISIAANTYGNGWSFTNPNAATSSNQRYSPFIQQEGFSWDSGIGTSASIRFRFGVVPVQSINNRNANWVLEASTAGGSFAEVMRANSLGGINVTGGIGTTGVIDGGSSISADTYIVSHGNDVRLQDDAGSGGYVKLSTATTATNDTLTLNLNAASRTLSLTGNAVLNQNVTTTGTPTFTSVTAGNFIGPISGASSLTLTPVASPAYAAGKLVYDSDNESLTFFNNDSAVALQVGQETWVRVRNDTGSTIVNGRAVYISGASGGVPQITLANAGAQATAAMVGLATEDIATGTIGFVTIDGVVRGIDTSAFSVGATLYLSTTNGLLTATAPVNPNYQVTVGKVTVSNASTGAILVGVSAGRIAGSLAYTDVANIFTAPQTFTPAVRTSGVAPYFQLNIPADTGITAATEGVGYRHSSATRTWATTGTVALQRENYFAGPTYASAGASQTFTDVFTAYFDRPIAGANAIFTRPHTLGVVDSTAATSTTTGGLVVATTLGTTATSIGMGGGNIYLGGLLNVGGTATVVGAFTASSTSAHNGAATFSGSNASTAVTITQTARTTGVLPYIAYTIPADTGRTASTEAPGWVGTTGTRTWATTGTVALQREIFFPGPTYASASASQTFTDAFNMYLTPPVAGTNAIFTRGHTMGIVDATSASSSITGGLIVSAAVGTTATSVGIGGGNVNAGTAITAPSLVSTSNILLASSATPTTTAAQMAFDNNAWATSFGAVQVDDGTNDTFLVGVLASDTPSNGQFPRWNTGGTITWESPTAAAAGSDTYVQFNDGGTALGGDAGMTYNKTTDVLSVSGGVSVGTGASTAGALVLSQGTTQSTGTTNITRQAPAAVTSYIITEAATVGSNNAFITQTTSGTTAQVVNTKIVPTGTVVGTTDTQTLTNKNVQPRITAITSSATPAYDVDASDVVNITALATAITSMTSSRTGTPYDFQQVEFRIKDNGTARAITWGADFASGIATLPTTTTLGKTLYVYCEFDTVTGDFMAQSVGSYP